MNLIKIAGLEMPIIDGNIGLNLSGGADSSLLLYILLSNKNKNDKIEIFTLATALKGRVTAKSTANVIEKCIQLTGNDNINHHVSYIKEDHLGKSNRQLFEMPIEFLANKKINAMYAALTSNPPLEIAESFNSEFSENKHHIERDPLEDKPKEIINKNLTLYLPFRNIDKKVIAEMYHRLGLIDSLFPLTRSCEIPNRLDYVNHCGNCWWCKERIWAFNRL
jgi:7-cyano-7-deazaguanine synthase in queuosine biosynthesis